MSKLISFGEILVDQISQSSDTANACFAGGAPANVAVFYSKLNGSSFFVGGLGTDDHAQFLHKELQRFGVNTNYIKKFDNTKTATAIITLDKENDRSFKIFRDGTADTLFTKKHFDPDIFQQALFFHFCSNTLTDQPLYDATEHGIELALNNNLIVSFDVNLRFNLWSENSPIEEVVFSMITKCDIIKMSLCELEFLANSVGNINTQYIARCFMYGVSIVLVTDGKKNLRCYTKSKSLSLTPPKIIAKDTTAAGDAFISGFLLDISSEVNNREDLKQLCSSVPRLKKALKFAASCGAFTCRSQGAFDAFPCKADLDHFISSNNE